ncbi:uncharacterized protein LOC124413324 [Diprion similis]|uniref:uncharacterized protein LOC124413324 n=1 Tax=Diprion similis TaxID=362088 RepID=UPI001EF9531B|nr:uncharacterized protein LOC124413324 [Diprion similis]
MRERESLIYTRFKGQECIQNRFDHSRLNFAVTKVKMNKLVLIGILCVCVATALKPRADTKAKCYAQTGLAVDDVKAMKTSTPKPEQQKLIVEYLACFMQDRAMLTADGVFNAEACKKEIRPENSAAANPVIDACAGKRGSTAVETTTKLLKCLKEKDTKLLEKLDLF